MTTQNIVTTTTPTETPSSSSPVETPKPYARNSQGKLEMTDAAFEQLRSKYMTNVPLEPLASSEEAGQVDMPSEEAAVTSEVVEDKPAEPVLSKAHLKNIEREKKLIRLDTELKTREAKISDQEKRFNYMTQNLHTNPRAALEAVGLSIEWLAEVITNGHAEPRQKSEVEEVKEEIARLKAEREAEREARESEESEREITLIARGISDEITSGKYTFLQGDPAEFVDEVWTEVKSLYPRYRQEIADGTMRYIDLYPLATKRVNKLYAPDDYKPAAQTEVKKPVGATTISARPVATKPVEQKAIDPKNMTRAERQHLLEQRREEMFNRHGIR